MSSLTRLYTNTKLGTVGPVRRSRPHPKSQLDTEVHDDAYARRRSQQAVPDGRKSGYEVLEVDEFVDEVEEKLRAAPRENQNLKKQVEALKAAPPPAAPAPHTMAPPPTVQPPAPRQPAPAQPPMSGTVW